METEGGRGAFGAAGCQNRPVAFAPAFRWAGLALIAAAVIVWTPGCDRLEGKSAKTSDTAEVERKAGDFADYWAEVLRLSRKHSANPDSFALALKALPGSQLTEEEWEAWTKPYREDSKGLAVKLEEAMATVAGREGVEE